MNPFIISETAPLSQVIVHRPGWSHDNMHPKHIQEYFDNGECNPDYLLFDDLIDTHLAKQEHDEFTKVISTKSVYFKYDFSKSLTLVINN